MSLNEYEGRLRLPLEKIDIRINDNVFRKVNTANVKVNSLLELLYEIKIVNVTLYKKYNLLFLFILLIPKI